MRKILLLLPFFLWTCGGGGGPTEPEPPQLPTVTNIEVTTLEDTAKTFALTGTDPNNLALTYSISTQPQHGTISISGGAATYSPNANYHGQDVIAFLASSTNGNSNIGTIIITITPVDDEPNTMDVTATTDEDNSVTINLEAEEFDGDSIEFQVRNNPSNGTVTISGTTATYTPNQDWYGTDTFNFEAVDSNARSVLNVATATITVNPVNDAPLVENISDVETKRTQEIEIELLGTDIENDNLTYEIVTNPSFGNATIESNKLIFSANNTGNVSIGYKANDGILDSENEATIQIKINLLSTTIGETDVELDAYKIIEKNTGGFFVVGGKYSSNTSGSAININELDSYGNLISSQTFDYYGMDFAESIIKTNDGNYLITGSMQETVNDNSDPFLIKINEDGEVLSTNLYKKSQEIKVRDLIELNDGSIILVGYYKTSPTNQDIWFSKVDPDGNIISENTFSFSGSDEDVIDIIKLEDNNFMLTGYTELNNGDFALIKIDDNLNVIFTKNYGTTSFDRGRSSVELSNGDILSVGFQLQNRDIFLVKTNLNGDLIFTKNLDSNINGYWEDGNKIIKGHDNNYIICGRRQDEGFLMMKIDENGNEIWKRTYTSGNDNAYDIIKTIDGEYVLLGLNDYSDHRITFIKVDEDGNRTY